MSKDDLAQTKNYLYIKARIQGHIEVVNACNTSSYCDTLMCQMWYDYVNRKKSCGLNRKPC